MAKHWYKNLKSENYVCDIDWAECIYERIINRRPAGTSKVGMKHHPKDCKECPIYINWKKSRHQTK